MSAAPRRRIAAERSTAKSPPAKSPPATRAPVRHRKLPVTSPAARHGVGADGAARYDGPGDAGEVDGDRSDRPDETAVLLASGYEVVFVPGDPARLGELALYAPPGGVAAPDGLDAEIEVVLPRGKVVRRQRVPARRLSVDAALTALRGLDPTSARPSAIAWSCVLTTGLGLVAAGRLLPAVSTDGYDSWEVGPLGPAELRMLASLADSLPPAAHALALGSGVPLRLASPEALVRAAWDAIADTLVRTAAAPALAVGNRYAGREPEVVTDLRPWLADASQGLQGGAAVALRVELGDEEPRAVLQLTSRVESSLVVDAAELFGAPANVISRFGADAETDLLLALRRGARAWPPLEPLLHERVPGGLVLDDDMLAELLADGATVLQGTGIEVLWPAELLHDKVELRAAIVTAPGKVDEAGFDLRSLLAFRWQATLGGDVLTEEEVEQLAEAKRGLVRLRGRFVAADPALLARLRARRVGRLGAAEALGALLAGGLEMDGELVPVVAEGPLADLAERLAALADGSLPELGTPDGLVAELRPYQYRGVAWLHEMAACGLGGCLADDMGLGKTLQVIALHLHRRSEGEGPMLVVCPTSLVGNWEREVKRFAPSVAVRRYHGTGRSLEQIGDDEIVVTSYGVARIDHQKLDDAGFSLVVADEAQHAKNPHSATARALRAIKAPARVALTGTPVENRLSELWSILDWTTPGLLGPLDRFVRTVAVPIERYRDPGATERLARSVQPFVLRRRKSDPTIAPDLPERIVTDVAVPLSPEQTTLYEAEVREALAAIAEREGFARQGLVLRLLTVLKQICNHPAQYLHQAGPIAGRSGKLDALEELLEVILAEGDSVLVFSQFVECCGIIEARLAELGIPTLLLHGGLGARQRTAMVDAFQAGEVRVFLLSLKAGGVGLNLTRANHVVHYDRWWNPAVEDQATDRAHRIGQRRAVQVHRLVAEGTLEDRIAELIEKKRSLAEAVVGGGEAWIAQMSDDELAELVRLGSGS